MLASVAAAASECPSVNSQLEPSLSCRNVVAFNSRHVTADWAHTQHHTDTLITRKSAAGGARPLEIWRGVNPGRKVLLAVATEKKATEWRCRETA